MGLKKYTVSKNKYYMNNDWKNHNQHSLEMELTSKCTLGCPSCPRNLDGKGQNERWDFGHFDTNLAKHIADTTSYYQYLFIGCYGDVIYHPDFLEICDYYQNTRNKKLVIHTNGSAKPKKFWDTAASLTWNKQTEFHFAVDGLSDTNHIYRINSKWDQIEYAMRTMCSIPYGKRPVMIWKYLIFPYNEHQVEQARELAAEIGFDKFHAVRSWRGPKRYPAEMRDLYVFKD